MITMAMMMPLPPPLPFSPRNSQCCSSISVTASRNAAGATDPAGGCVPRVNRSQMREKPGAKWTRELIPFCTLYTKLRLSSAHRRCGGSAVIDGLAPTVFFQSKSLITPSSTALTLAPKLSEPKEISIRRLSLGALVFSVCFLACQVAFAAGVAADSIRASGIGLKVATALRSSGWPDEVVVFALATLPIIELRGAIPVGYWMKLKPLHLTVLSIIGNMVPVPIIILYLKKFASFLSQRNASATNFFDLLFKRFKEKAGPVEEFQWLGLMLFVAVPFPGTGAWTGAFIAAILDMPFWSAVSANFFGVVLAGLLVNLLVNLGIKYAVVVGSLMFFVSTIMWSVLRRLKKSLNSN